MMKKDLLQKIDERAKALLWYSYSASEQDVEHNLAQQHHVKQACVLIERKGKELLDLLNSTDLDEKGINDIIKKKRIINGLTNGELYETLFLYNIREEAKITKARPENDEVDTILHTQEAEEIRERLHKHTRKSMQELKQDIAKKVRNASYISQSIDKYEEME